LIHSSVVGHLGWFQSLVIVNSATVNIGVQMSLLYPALHSFSRSPGVVSLDHDSSIFGLLRNLHTTFHNGCINLHFHQQCIRVPVSPHPYQHLSSLLHLNMAILTGVRWNLSVVLIWISFIPRQIEHFCIYLWPSVPFPLRIPCLIHVPMSSLGCWFFGSWVLEFSVDPGY
jgi:hypothetical protein